MTYCLLCVLHVLHLHNIIARLFAQHGWTPLMNAAVHNHHEVCKMLLRRGALPDSQTKVWMGAELWLGVYICFVVVACVDPCSFCVWVVAGSMETRRSCLQRGLGTGKR